MLIWPPLPDAAKPVDRSIVPESNRVEDPVMMEIEPDWPAEPELAVFT
jgi:hypothetical protein